MRTLQFGKSGARGVLLPVLLLLGCGGEDLVEVGVPVPTVMTMSPPSVFAAVGDTTIFTIAVVSTGQPTAPTLASCWSSPAKIVEVKRALNACVAVAIASGPVTITAVASDEASVSGWMVVSAPPSASVDPLTRRVLQ